MVFNKVLDQSIVLFILIVVGFIARKRNVISDDTIKGFSDFVLKITLPISIIVSMDNEFSRDKMIYSGLILFIGLFTYAFKLVLSKFFIDQIDALDIQKGVYRFLIIFSNSVFMGYPIAHAVYGDDGVFYVAILNILFNILVWTLGVKLADSSGSSKGTTFKELILNPGIFSVFIGLLLFLTPLTLPKILHDSMSMMGNTTTPIAMVIVGGILGGSKIKDAFKDRKIILVSIIRLLIVPLCILFALLPFNLPKIVIGITVIVDAMPSGATAVIFARKYDSDYSLASKGVFLSTLMNIVTTPIILYIFISLTEK